MLGPRTCWKHPAGGISSLSRRLALDFGLVSLCHLMWCLWAGWSRRRPCPSATRYSPCGSMAAGSRRPSCCRRQPPPPSGPPDCAQAPRLHREPRPRPAGSPPRTRTGQKPAGHYPVETTHFSRRGETFSLVPSHPQLQLSQHGFQSSDVTNQISAWLRLQGQPWGLDGRHRSSQNHCAIGTSWRNRRRVGMSEVSGIGKAAWTDWCLLFKGSRPSVWYQNELDTNSSVFDWCTSLTYFLWFRKRLYLFLGLYMKSTPYETL